MQRIWQNVTFLIHITDGLTNVILLVTLLLKTLGYLVAFYNYRGQLVQSLLML